MKRSLYLLISATFALAFGACNQHSWEEGRGDQPPTKDLFKHGHESQDKDAHEPHEKEGHAGEKNEEKPH